MRVRELAIILLLAPGIAACDAGPVAWEETRVLPSTPRDGGGTIRLAGRDVAWAERTRPEDASPAGACSATVVYARLSTDEWHRAWWSTDASGRSRLLASRSDDGGITWRDAVVVDTTDASPAGCQRLPPAIAADSLTRYVHLVYYQRPRVGAGVWYAHSMDGGLTWHSNYGLLYGDDPARATVAADGALVAVAYELPNAAEQRVGLTLSRDGGHSFLPPIIVSSGSAPARAPIVAAHGRRVAVGWTGADGGTMVRVGEVRE